MRHFFTSLLLFAVINSLAQSQSPMAFSYQSVVRNANNELVTNQTIGIQISILQSSATGNSVYTEQHSVSTNSNGLFTLQVGEGTPVLGTFSSINWGNDTYFIQSEVDLGGGTNYNLSATQQLLSVPYALHAVTAGNQSDDQTLTFSGNTLSIEDGNSVVLPTGGSGTGLEQIVENGALGRRLVGVDTSYYGPIGDNALDLSSSQSPSTTKGATGDNSTALGYGTTSSGNLSTAMGAASEASGYSSTAMGFSTTASGQYSTASGHNTIASGSYSVTTGSDVEASGSYSNASGRGTLAKSYAETALGSFNTDYSPQNTTAWDANDRLIVIGDGTSNSNRSNALIIYKNGTVNINDAYDLPNTDGSPNQVLGTNGAGVTSWVNSANGLEQITEGGNTGWRLIGRDTANYGDIGDDAVDFSISIDPSTTQGATGVFSVAFGRNTVASGFNSTVLGRNTTASSNYSTALGYGTTASGNYSTALGYGTAASGLASTALGYATTASGIYSTAMGYNVNATGNGELYNSGNVKGTSFSSTSDKRVKRNIQDFSGALDKVMQLQARTYFYDVDQFPRFEAERDKPQIGFVAQEVETILPEMVLTDGDEVGLKSIRYGQLTPVLVEAIKEQQEIIEEQKTRNEEQSRKIEVLEEELKELRSMLDQLLSNQGE